MTPPVALTIAGSDSGGGAGIQADLKTFAAFGCFGTSVLTALTAQNTRGVTAIEPVSPGFVKAQLDAVFDDFDVRAVKIGMIADAEVIATVADALERRRPAAIVLDPVMVAASGARLVSSHVMDVSKRRLFPLATIVTPNLHEAEALTGLSVTDEAAMAEAGRALLALGPQAVLMKGGHATDAAAAIDLLVTPESVRRFSAPRVATANLHGTGCTLSSAIAAGLAQGMPLEAAVERAKRYVSGAIRAAAGWRLGAGPGPLDHFAAGREG